MAIDQVSMKKTLKASENICIKDIDKYLECRLWKMSLSLKESGLLVLRDLATIIMHLAEAKNTV